MDFISHGKFIAFNCSYASDEYHEHTRYPTPRIVSII